MKVYYTVFKKKTASGQIKKGKIKLNKTNRLIINAIKEKIEEILGKKRKNEGYIRGN